MIFLGFWQFSAEGRLRPTILRFSKKVYFLRGSKRFRYHYMQEVVPCCAIFAKLQNSLIQPRTSQKKFSLFENVSYFVFIVWRSTDRQFFYSPKVSDFCVDRFVATRGKLRVSEVCSNKPKFSNL